MYENVYTGGVVWGGGCSHIDIKIWRTGKVEPMALWCDPGPKSLGWDPNVGP